jgi:hypothetical protein
MANETTTTTLSDLTHASLIEPYLIAALSEQPGLYRFCKEFNAVGRSTNAIKLPIETSWWGSADDNGAGVDTEFDGSQGTALSNTAVSINSSATITCAEYGVALEVTDNADEDSVDGLDLMMRLEQRMLHVLSLAMEDDFIAKFAGLSNSVGVSGSDLTVAQLLSAFNNIRKRGAIAETLVGVLDNEQIDNVQTALIATNAAQAVYAMAVDRILAYAPSADRGMGPQRQVATFAGYPIFVSGLTDFAGVGDPDVVGAAFVPSTAYNDAAGNVTFGMAWKRLPRFEIERDAKKRTTNLVMTCRWGVAELCDGSGTAIITDAP